MMTEPKQFFERLKEQREKNFPFVAYHDPSATKGTTKAFLQASPEVYKTENFTEAGFVFAPFDDEKEAVLIPQEKSESLETIFAEEDNILLHQNISYSNSQAIKEKERHIDLVQKGIDAINRGDLKKVVVSRKEVLQSGPQDELELFQRLLRRYPDAFVYVFYHPMVGTWLGATPEILIKVERNLFKTMALAGTKKYTGDKEVDWGEKEKEEQKIVTDTILENLEGSCRNIEIKGPYTTRAGDLLHLRTDITGEVISNPESKNENSRTDANHPRTGGMQSVSTATGGNLKNLISAIHPTPAICGHPLKPARHFILENENYDREFYAGFLGEINMKKEVKRNSNRRNQENQAYSSYLPKTSLYVNLRCMKLNTDTVELFVGGGITRESHPALEWEETQSKAGTMKAVLDMLDRKMG